MTKEDLKVAGRICENIADELGDTQKDFERHKERYIEEYIEDPNRDLSYSLGNVIFDYMKLQILKEITLPQVTDAVHQFQFNEMSTIKKQIAKKRGEQNE